MCVLYRDHFPRKSCLRKIPTTAGIILGSRTLRTRAVQALQTQNAKIRKKNARQQWALEDRISAAGVVRGLRTIEEFISFVRPVVIQRKLKRSLNASFDSTKLPRGA